MVLESVISLLSFVGENIQEKETGLHSKIVPAAWDCVTSEKPWGVCKHESGRVGAVASWKGWHLAQRILNPVGEVMKQETKVGKERDP